MVISSPVRAVLLTAKAIDLDIDYREINLWNGDHLKPEYLKMNPQHSIPTLDDNGQYLWDSHAISTYLIEKYAKDDSLYPKDLYKRARIDQRLHFDSGILYIRLVAIARGIYYTDDTIISADKIKAVLEAYDLLEVFFQEDLYLVGNSLTVADLVCIANVSSMDGLVPIDAVKYPKLTAWLERVKQLPYYEEANGKHDATYIKFLKDLLAKKSAPKE